MESMTSAYIKFDKSFHPTMQIYWITVLIWIFYCFHVIIQSYILSSLLFHLFLNDFHLKKKKTLYLLLDMAQEGERLTKIVCQELQSIPNLLPGGGIHDKWVDLV